MPSGLNKNIGSKSLHHFIQRLLVPFVGEQVTKPLHRPDEVPTELFKTGDEIVPDRMARICVAVWEWYVARGMEVLYIYFIFKEC